MPVPGHTRRMPLLRTLASVAAAGLFAAGLSVPAVADVATDEDSTESTAPAGSGGDAAITPAVAEVDGVDLTEIHYAAGDDEDFIEISAEPGTDISGWVAGSITRGPDPQSGEHVVTVPDGTEIPESGHYAIDVPITNSTTGGYGSSAFVTTSFEADADIVGFWTIGERDGDEGTTAGNSDLLPEAIRGETARATGVTGSTSNSIQWVEDEWLASAPTPGEPYETDDDPGDPGDPGDPDELEIAEVWGVDDGASVTTTGVVTAHYATGGFNGYTIQTPGTGGDADLDERDVSDALFVYSPSTVEQVELGDYVQVTGERGEYNGLHQISADEVQPVAEDFEPVLPVEDFVLPATDDERLAFQNMLVHPADRYVVSDTYALGGFGDTRFGTIGLGLDAPLVQETDVANPDDPSYADVVAANDARAVTLDDGQSERTDFDAEVPYLTGEENVRTGVELTFNQPVVVDYRFQWNFQPTTPVTGNADDLVTFDGGDTREANSAAVDVGGDVQVAIFNVLNYFTTLGSHFDGSDFDGCEPYTDREDNPLTVANCTDPNPGPRGAWDEGVLEWQEAKIVAAINELDADVVALSEIENSAHFTGDRDQSLQILVDALNADAGSEIWAFAPSPEAVPDLAHDDVIRNAFIYQPEAVEPAGDGVILTGQSADGAAFDNAREPLAQPFGVVDSDYEFLAVANHFKSKGGDCDSAIPEGCFNEDRVEQAQSLMDFADEVAAEAGIEDILLMGDFNSYSAEDPVQAFEDAGYVNANPAWDPENTEFTGDNTYVFDGRVGSLDHIFISGDAAERHTGTEVWSINANESVLAEYSRHNYFASEHFTEGVPFRSSDHDPVVIGLDVPEPGDPGDPDLVDLRVLSFNDFHGRIGSDEDNVGDDAVAAGMACYVDQQRAENDNTLLVSGGDNIGGTTFTSFIDDDYPTLDVLNELDLDVSVLGNHEFDQGREDVDDRVLGYSDFPWIAANIIDDNTGDLAYDPYTIVETDDVSVAFIGAITENMPNLVSPAGIEDLSFTSMSEAVNEQAQIIAQEEDADAVIVLVHDGYGSGVSPEDASGPYADLVNNADDSISAIISGHSHQEYTHQVGDMWVTQAGQYGEMMGVLDLTIDPGTGEVTGSSAQNVEIEPAGADECAAAEGMMGIVDEARENAEELGAEVIGEATHEFNRAQDGDGAENRGGESVLGALVADAHLWAAQQTNPEAQIAFMNSGGLRTDLPAGEVTYRAAAEIQPFANTLTSLELTGAQLADVLEEQWQEDGMLKLGHSSEFRYLYDPQAQPGERITEMFLDGEPIQDDEHYTVVANDFIATGGDDFGTFAEGRNADSTGQIDLEATVSYIEEHSPITPDFSQRAVGLTWVTDPDAVYAPGDEIGVDLSSMAFTAGEPVPEVLSTNLGGVDTGEFELDATAVDGTDEAGRAEIRAEVPEVLEVATNTSGGIGTMAAGGAADADPAVYVFEITDETNGTVVAVPVLIAGAGDSGPGDEAPGDEAPGDAAPGDDLPQTGANVAWLAVAALILLALGTLLVVRRRRAGTAGK